MSRKDIEDIVTREITNDEQTRKYLNEVGHSARVERESVPANSGVVALLREVLEDIGRDIMAETGHVPKGFTYVGSAAVHIYSAPATGTVLYFNQLALGQCPEALAGPAVSDLRGAMLNEYGHRRQKLRSGF